MNKQILCGLLILLSACSNYKLDVQQGNLVTQDTISKLQQGMSKQEVQSLLGTPLLQDSFDNNRWDYLFYSKKNKTKSQNITLRFKDDQLINVSH
ncbi:MAG: outer membrane protein assembly factor BamE [Aquificaceae bacterium]|nr:MAG: outer membrane protein assembly factor BamE [Aquificaceae bacterium]